MRVDMERGVGSVDEGHSFDRCQHFFSEEIETGVRTFTKHVCNTISETTREDEMGVG